MGWWIVYAFGVWEDLVKSFHFVVSLVLLSDFIALRKTMVTEILFLELEACSLGRRIVMVMMKPWSSRSHYLAWKLLPWGRSGRKPQALLFKGYIVIEVISDSYKSYALVWKKKNHMILNTLLLKFESFTKSFSKFCVYIKNIKLMYVIF